MLQNGKINATDAEKLLEKVEKNTSNNSHYNGKNLKVFVERDAEVKININVPISLAKLGIQMAQKEKLNLNNNPIDLDEVLKMIEENAEGELVNIDTDDNGIKTRVQIAVV